MPGLHLHRGKGREEKRGRGPDIVSVKIGHGRRDRVEFREGPGGILAERLYLIQSWKRQTERLGKSGEVFKPDLQMCFTGP
jgi:hypothetical protein